MRLSKPRVRPQSKTFLSSRLETGSVRSSHVRSGNVNKKKVPQEPQEGFDLTDGPDQGRS